MAVNNAITGLFGEYASDAEQSGSEGQDASPDSGVVLLQAAEDPARTHEAHPLTLRSVTAEPAQPGAADDRAADSATPPESKGHSPAVHSDSGLPAYLLEAPPGSVTSEMKGKINHLLGVKRQRGATLAEIMTKHQGARNPDFLRKMVEHFDIQEYGSCFPKDKFDLQALPKEDFFDRLAAQQAEAERRREEIRKASGRVEFVPPANRNTPPSSAAGTMSAASVAAQAKVTAKRGSKWDTAPKR